MGDLVSSGRGECVSTTLVSVIIPTFNRQDQLALALDAVISQTVKLHEIVVVDDGSTDGTPETLQEFARLHPDVRLIVIRQKNRGPAAARNAGIKVATGELVAFLDDDDVWHPEKLERQLTVLVDRPEIGLLGCATDTFKPTWRSRIVDIGEWNLLFRNWFLTPGVIARRDVLIACGGFPEDMRHCEDYALWLRIASGHKCVFLNEVLVSCGHGKAPFGVSGLLADLSALREGEKIALDRWHKYRQAGLTKFALVSLWAYVRHVRRCVIVFSRRYRSAVINSVCDGRDKD